MLSGTGKSLIVATVALCLTAGPALASKEGYWDSDDFMNNNSLGLVYGAVTYLVFRITKLCPLIAQDQGEHK